MLVLKLLVMTGCVYVGLSPSYPNNPALHLAETGVHAGVLTLVTWWLHLMRRRMITLTQRLQFLSDTDALTGLHNRRYLDQHVGEVVDSARTSGRRLAALVIDLDHFKRINDALGHEAGDRVLVAVANSIRSVLHSGELLARTGGEELLILTAVTTHSLAVRLAELVRQAVIESGTPIDITCSVGVATALVPAQEDPTRFVWALVSRADRAMYRAKLAGRNLVVEDDNDVGEG
jgi:diguanylate cyclase (GGDEF)-like protein